MKEIYGEIWQPLQETPIGFCFKNFKKTQFKQINFKDLF